jgi:hypothetical protein
MITEQACMMELVSAPGNSSLVALATLREILDSVHNCNVVGVDMHKITMNALKHGSHKVLHYLLEQGCSPNFNLDDALVVCGQHGSVNTATYLLNRGAKASYNALWSAVFNKQDDMAVLMLDQGVDVSPNSDRAFVFGVYNGLAQFVDKCLDGPIPIGFAGGRFLIEAIATKKPEMVLAFLKGPERADYYDRWTLGEALMRIIRDDLNDIFDVFMANNGANLDLDHQEGEALVAAAQHNNYHIVKGLLENGANVEYGGNEALEKTTNAQIEDVLIEYGADATFLAKKKKSSAE